MLLVGAVHGYQPHHHCFYLTFLLSSNGNTTEKGEKIITDKDKIELLSFLICQKTKSISQLSYSHTCIT